MTILLTDNGWVNRETGEDLGTWDNEADLVDLGDKIVVYRKFVVNALEGDDLIIGSSELGVGIKNFGTIQTVEGNDTITSNGGLAGIFNGRFGTITTGEDDDVITGSDALIGIENLGMIKTGGGNDIITGSGSEYGIFNFGMIETGDGSDTVDAFSGGFTGFGTINLGPGDDLIKGFGEQIVDGGDGYDTAALGFNYDKDRISLGSTADTSIDITFSGQTMSFDNVEGFDFNGQTLTFDQLKDVV